jgi:hypothetical protein
MGVYGYPSDGEGGGCGVMITKQQAMTESYFHYTGNEPCKRTVGLRGGVTEKVTNVRANGKCKTWKRSPERFQLPFKYGMYGHGYITEDNAGDFHVASECPLCDNE